MLSASSPMCLKPNNVCFLLLSAQNSIILIMWLFDGGKFHDCSIIEVGCTSRAGMWLGRWPVPRATPSFHPTFGHNLPPKSISDEGLQTFTIQTRLGNLWSWRIYHRPLLDLRISVTDRCNMRCRYCMPREHFDDNHEFLPKDDILRFEEIVRVVEALIPHGLRKVRLTEASPLLRRDLDELVRQLRACSERSRYCHHNQRFVAQQASVQSSRSRLESGYNLARCIR